MTLHGLTVGPEEANAFFRCFVEKLDPESAQASLLKGIKVRDA